MWNRPDTSVTYSGILVPMVSRRTKFGRVGEQAVANHLARKGYVLRETNYLKKWGEIDLILEKDGAVHFVEVKTVARETASKIARGGRRDSWRPEDNVDSRKLTKLFRIIETWLIERRYDGPWQLDVASVQLDREGKRGSVRLIENVVKDS